MKTLIVTLAILSGILVLGCDDPSTTVDAKQSAQQAQALEQAHEAVGMPSTPGWQEKRMMKDLYELRDKAIATHSYIVNEMAGCLVYLGPSQGYGLPYATQYSSPEKDIYATTSASVHHNVPQAEPNGLFMPASAEGTWIMLLDPGGSGKTMPIYVEPRVVVSPFRLDAQECPKSNAAVVGKAIAR